ncbi:MAG: hypothetical protein HY873_14040 [Chloroflexi bacterium]|nr:hypothetical protein [Chloroflexota bacterium]
MDMWNGIFLLQLPAVVALVGSIALCYHEGALCRLMGGHLSQWTRGLCVLLAAGAWVALTLASWWCLVDWTIISIVISYALFGMVGGWIALVANGVIAGIIPMAWGILLTRLLRREFRYTSLPDELLALGVAKPPLRGMPS